MSKVIVLGLILFTSTLYIHFHSKYSIFFDRADSHPEDHLFRRSLANDKKVINHVLRKEVDLKPEANGNEVKSA